MSISHLLTDNFYSLHIGNVHFNRLSIGTDGSFITTYKETGTLTTTLSGTCLATPLTISYKLSKLNDVVTFTILNNYKGAHGSTGSHMESPTSAIPHEYCPETSDRQFEVYVTSGGNIEYGTMMIHYENGHLEFSLDKDGSNFGTGGDNGVYATSVTYHI